MNIAYISTTRYPTEKAYGVTTGETAKAARSLGLKFVIFSPNFEGSDQYGNNIVKITNTSKLRNRGKLNFILRSFYYASELIGHSKLEVFHILWMRDPYLSLALAFRYPSKKILLELHHRPSLFTKIILKVLTIKQNTILVTISEKHKKLLGKDFKLSKIVIAPMSAPSEYFQSLGKYAQFDGDLKVGYLGKASSSGIDNDLETLFSHVIHALQRNNEISFKFLGLEGASVTRFLKKLSDSGIPYERVTFFPQGDSKRVRSFLQEIDIGLLPYPANQYNSFRVPLKLLEYAAAGVTILASDFFQTEGIVNDHIALFYRYSDSGHFYEKLLEASDEVISNKLREAAHEWVSELTYEARVTKVVSFIEKSQSRSKSCE